MRKTAHGSRFSRAARAIIAALSVMAVAGLPSGCGVTDDALEVKPARRSMTIGIAGNLRSSSSSARRRDAGRLRDAGLSVAREDFEWNRIESRPGRFDWRRIDALMRDTARERIVVLPLLLATPGWAGSSLEGMPSDPGAFATFSARVVARYAPGGSFWRAHRELDGRLAPRWFELYNEPYLDPEGDPEAYARVVRAAVTQARTVNRRARFLAAGETTIVDGDGLARPWLQALYEADPAFGEVYDALAVHPYSSGRPALEYTPGSRNARWQTRRVEEIRATLERHGDAGKKLWLTEIGWSTCRLGAECVSRSAQAEYLRDVFGLVGGPWRSFVDAVFVYTLSDHRASPDDKEGSFGLLDRLGGAKPAWRVLNRLARR